MDIRIEKTDRAIEKAFLELRAKTPLEKRRSISLFCFSLPHSVVCRNCSLTLPQQQ